MENVSPPYGYSVAIEHMATRLVNNTYRTSYPTKLGQASTYSGMGLPWCGSAPVAMDTTQGSEDISVITDGSLGSDTCFPAPGKSFCLRASSSDDLRSSQELAKAEELLSDVEDDPDLTNLSIWERSSSL